MPDDEGYLVPGDLPLGTYAGLEGDLGEGIRPLAGFGREILPPEDSFSGNDADEWLEMAVNPGGFSTGLPVRYVLTRGWGL